MIIEKVARRKKYKLPPVSAKLNKKNFDSAGWQYLGEIVDHKSLSAKCLCGNAIRYEHILTKGVKKLSVGSCCLFHFFS